MRLTPLRRHGRTRPVAPRRPQSPVPPARPRRTSCGSATAAPHDGRNTRTGSPSGAASESGALRRAHRRRRVFLLSGWLAVAGVLLTSSAARAETVQVVALAQTVDQVFANIRNWIMGILAAIAIVLFTIAGLRYLLASGDPGEIEKAKGAFKAGCIGFGLAALAPLVVEILKGIVGGV